MVEEILHNAVKKQIELIDSCPKWRDELYDHAPPILWFGNTITKKDKIVTVGANPSRWEVISKDRCPINRFRVLTNGEFLKDILIDRELANQILVGYNSYFQNDPYTKWFGKGTKPYNVECFIRGMKASFYTGVESHFTSIHIDLFLFATKSDYKEIKTIVKKDLFSNDWARQIMFSLIDHISPRFIIVFGRANASVLFSEILKSSENILFERFELPNGKKSFYSKHVISTDSKEYSCFLLSANLGNPKPFNKEELHFFGKEVSEFTE